MRFFKFFSALIFFSLCLVSGPAVAKKKSELEALTKTFKSLQEKALVNMQLKKKVTSPFYMTPRESEGELYFSKGKIRLSIVKPEVSLLVLNGNDIWLEEKLSEDSGGVVQVSHYETSKASKSSALLALLFGESEIWKEFKLMSRSEEDGKTIYKLEPNDKSRLDVTQLSIELDKSSKHQLTKVSFSDNIENLTEYEFSKIKTQSSAKPNLFKYTPPKGAQVTKF